jgi:hypothetical protein
MPLTPPPPSWHIAIQPSIRRSQRRARCGAVRKCTVALLSPTRPSSGVYCALVSLAGGRRKAARQGGEGTTVSSTAWSTWFRAVGVTVWGGPGSRRIGISAARAARTVGARFSWFALLVALRARPLTSSATR